MAEARPMRYGDFPQVFEGFPPDEEVDLYDTRTILRLMAYAEATETSEAPDEAAMDETRPLG